MSAFDIAGAVVWSPLALLFGAVWVMQSPDRSAGWSVAGFVIALLLTLAAVFCIARLCGAHL